MSDLAVTYHTVVSFIVAGLGSQILGAERVSEAEVGHRNGPLRPLFHTV